MLKIRSLLAVAWWLYHLQAPIKCSVIRFTGNFAIRYLLIKIATDLSNCTLSLCMSTCFYVWVHMYILHMCMYMFREA